MNVTTIDGEARLDQGEHVDLSMLRTDEHGKIVEIVGGLNLRKRLSVYGLGVGDIIRVVSNNGPVTVCINTNTISMGKGIARKIHVERICNEKKNV
ncbi:MAG TPA: FeoA family protein [Candidatus Methanofastidiosa archaeon]|nr:FeoA family protein [Candidatus Methanofastidiosa archaeon]HPR41849.1 FeoA family protein [Candidatus Methanofastidiosa archaeon]